jgi:hypothetical protein
VRHTNVIMVSLVVVVFAGFAGAQASMGTVSMDGGCEYISFTVASVGTGTDHDIIGTVVNKLGGSQKCHDVIFQIIAESPAGCSPPLLIGGKGKAGQGPICAGSANAANNTVTISFGSPGFPTDNSASIELDISPAPGTPTCTKFQLAVCPSATGSLGVAVDVFDNFAFKPDNPTITNGVGAQGDPGMRAVVNNLRVVGNQNIIGFNGTFNFGSAPANTITGVYLHNAADELVSGTSIVISHGNQFSITGVALSPGQFYFITLLFEAVPLGATSLALTATFQE